MRAARSKPDDGTPDPGSWSALSSGAITVVLPQVGALRVSGPDGAAFLNGQLANDVAHLESGGSLRSAYLNVRGHALAEMRVQRRESDLHLAVEDGGAHEVAKRLLAHKVFDQVELTDLSGTLSTLTVQGPRATEVVESALGIEPLHDGHFATVPFGEAEVLALRNRRSVAGGVDVHLLSRQLAELIGALHAAGAVEGDEESIEASRIEAGLPRAALDAGPGVLPQEAGLTAAISTRKGCYLGQEVMARIEARAQLRRSLKRLRLDRTPPDLMPGQAVMHGDKAVGRLGSVALHPELGTLALAVLRNDVSDGAILRVGPVAAAILAS